MINIAKEGDPIVSQKALEVVNVSSQEVQETIRKLQQVMVQTGAMGFAAPQIRIPLRIFIFSSYPHINHEDAPLIAPTVVINPTISNQEGLEKTWEKCYSLPGVRGYVPRFRIITASYLTADGRSIDNLTLEGFPAQLFQHENDHLDGKFYKGRIRLKDRSTDIISNEEYKRRFGKD